MSATMLAKKLCVPCNKMTGILVCVGCQQGFCGKHLVEHRQELGVKLDGIMQEHDSLQQELQQPSSKKNALLERITAWEVESVAKIRVAADNARRSLEEMLERSREDVVKACRDITETLRSSREADDFSEGDLIQWMKQVKALQKEIKRPSSVNLVYEESSAIAWIAVKGKNTASGESASKEKPPEQGNQSKPTIQERFLQIIRPVSLSESGSVSKRVGSRTGFAHMRGQYKYSTSCFTIRFRIEQGARPYRIFFGCMSSEEELKENAFKCPQAVGWFGFDQVYEHGRCTSNVSKYGYYSSKIDTNDELHLTLDCDNKQIRLFHEREKRTSILSVNTKLAPLPWQFLVVLCHAGDSVRILPSA